MVDYRDGVAIGEIIVYVPLLVIASFLAISHGFGRNSGWIYLIFFALIQIVGSAIQLVIVHHPNNSGLFTGAAILETMGLSPLTLAALGLLSRVISSINKVEKTFPTTRQLQFAELLTSIALALGIVGDIHATHKVKSTGRYVPHVTGMVSVGLIIAAYAFLVLSTILTCPKISRAEPGEKRLLLAVILSLPFIFVRVLYAALANYDSHNNTFNQISGSVTCMLVMGRIMELVAVIIFEGVGLTVRKLEAHERHPDAVAPLPAQGPPVDGTSPLPEGQKSVRNMGRSILKFLGRETLTGKLIKRAMAAWSNHNDLEKQQQPAHA